MGKDNQRKRSTRQVIAFFAALLAIALCVEMALRALNPVGRLPVFPHNDYEITLALHGSTEFDRIFYGSSPVVAAFRGADTASGYTEFGLVFGKITYLLTLLEEGHITVREDIVLGLNVALFMDTLDTDPRYPWHQGTFEPYVYFHRNRLNTFFQSNLSRFLEGDFYLERHENLEKWLYFGVLPDEALDNLAEAHMARFGDLTLADFVENLAALERLIAFCEANDIRLRAVWMPVNPDIDDRPQPEVFAQANALAHTILTDRGIEVKDMTHAFPREYFYDFGHMNFEVGAVAFTKEIDLWLNP